jgi:hypothetical protein
MLNLWGRQQRFCGGVSRRSFLKIGALGAGLTLADLLRSRSQAATAQPPRAKSIIMICLFGGPPHTDMYDLKPEASAEYRGEFKPIRTNVPGVDICELFPLQAKMWDKLAVVRSVVAGQADHRDQETHTGFVRGRPCFGSIVSKLRGISAAGIPPFVNLRFESSGLDPAYLGVAHRAFAPNGTGVRNLSLAADMPAARLGERRELLAGFDDVRRDLDASGAMAGLDDFQKQAFDMVLSGNARKALDLAQEEPATLERYKGVEKFLAARRLVEAGVGAVTLDLGNWDTHFDNFKYLKEWLPKVDRAVSNLIQDLHDRGLDRDVVTVMWGEFGRTPRINQRAGRDHWDPAMFALVAGGGLEMGQAIGSTTERGERPKDRPYRVPQVLSTIYQAVGIDPAATFRDGSGRPMYILEDREPVAELL